MRLRETKEGELVVTKRILKQISVGVVDGHISVTLAYKEGPSEHLLLPERWALALAEKILIAQRSITDQKVAGSGVGVDDFASVGISKPKKETLQ